jgi:acyl-CoA thioesterase
MSGAFDRDTAVRPVDAPCHPRADGGAGSSAGAKFAAEISPEWRAGRGPNGGYMAAMLLRALTETVADPARSPRSLTIHFVRAPEPGPVEIHTVIERTGRSLSTLSARMERDGSVIALALAAFSVPWGGPEVTDLQMPAVAPPEPAHAAPAAGGGVPPFARHMVVQPRIGVPFAGGEQPMEIGAWMGLAEPRAIDPLSLAFFSDAMLPSPLVRLTEAVAAPTIDLTVHFRTPTGSAGDRDLAGPCFVQVRCRMIHEGFFEEDAVVFSREGAVLAQSRQLALVMPERSRSDPPARA